MEARSLIDTRPISSGSLGRGHGRVLLGVEFLQDLEYRTETPGRFAGFLLLEGIAPQLPQLVRSAPGQAAAISASPFVFQRRLRRRSRRQLGLSRRRIRRAAGRGRHGSVRVGVTHELAEVLELAAFGFVFGKALPVPHRLENFFRQGDALQLPGKARPGRRPVPAVRAWPLTRVLEGGGRCR